MKNNITIISLNFHPEDTAIGLYSTQMAEYLVSQGYNVTVITGFPYYPQWKIYESYLKKAWFLNETIKGLNIFRYKQYVPKTPTFFKRTIHMVDFTLGSLVNCFKVKKSDLVFCVVPFTTSIVLAKILSLLRKAPIWIHIQDFEFDAAFQTGVSKRKQSSNILYNSLFYIEKKLLNSSEISSTISHSMIEKLKKKTSNKETYFLPNWIDEDFISPLKAKHHRFFNKSTFNILYSGNIGEKQDWEFFVRLASKIEKYIDIRIYVVGTGAYIKKLEYKIADLKNVSIYSPVPYEELCDLLCSADAHVLFQKEDVLDTVMPSKLLGMMASAKPSIITGNLNSEVSRVIKISKGGFFFEPSNLDGVLDSIIELKKTTGMSDHIGRNARDFIVNKYSKKMVLSNLNYKIKEVLNN